jgi:predicted phage-related endonuclease
MKGESIMSTVELTSTARDYRQILAEIKALEEQADGLKQTMIREMDSRNAEELSAGEFTIRWSLYESSRIDTAAIKAAGLYDQYSKKTVSTRFQVA